MNEYNNNNDYGNSSKKLGFYSMAQCRRKLDSENKRHSRQIYSAGVLPFYVKNNTVYLLLGKDTDGKWSDFGGRSEGQDRGRWDSTASREFYEESVGAVMDIHSIFTKLQNRKNCHKLEGKTLNGSPYYMYFVRNSIQRYLQRKFFIQLLIFLGILSTQIGNI